MRLVHETPTAAILEGDVTLGYLPMVRATELAIAKAKQVGIGMGLVRYIGHYGSAGHYTRMCMEAGCVGFSVSN
jgi:LDH2 family malate/lactate/ureidoglycolate dehydrogenase